MIEVGVCQAQDMTNMTSQTDFGQVYRIDDCNLYKGLYVVKDSRMPFACINEFYASMSWRKKWNRMSGKGFGGRFDDDLFFTNEDLCLHINVDEELPITHIDKPACLFQYHWDFNYHHFLVSAMPRLAMLSSDNKKRVVILVRAGTPEYQVDFIKKLYPENIVYLIDVEKKYLIDELYVMDFFTDNANAIVDYFCDVKDRLGIYRRKYADCIYVSRKDAANKRPLKNDQAVSEIVKSSGCKEEVLSDYSINEKANIFYNSKKIVATFGAGVANILFCEKGAELVFIEHPVYKFVNIYREICEIKKIKYRIISTRTMKWRFYIFIHKFASMLGNKNIEWSNDYFWRVDEKLLKEVVNNS